ncbi:hypothetical protein [Thalassoporum mexicanum]|uniref:hypothetical protein n=1 Tax=Thalassoporum mexicanum TaxID=3457544 RepID=UPI000300AEB7|nr:hypothetical protein [Pseudanabaena sp. PCC 7367]
MSFAHIDRRHFDHNLRQHLYAQDTQDVQDAQDVQNIHVLGKSTQFFQPGDKGQASSARF